MRRIAEPLHIGWVGTGVMGAPMAGHLLAAGHALRVVLAHARAGGDARRAGRAAGATRRPRPPRSADVVCTMVGYPADVREVVLGEDGVLGALRDGGLLIDFTTSSPGLAEEIHAAAAERGAEALDAPVSGGDVGARNAKLVIMAGGERGGVRPRAPRVLDAVGERIVHAARPARASTRR